MDIEELGVQEQNALFSQIAEHSPNVLWVFSPDWSDIIFVNERYEEIWGRSIDALEAEARDFLEGIHPDDRDAVREAMAAISEGEARELEYRVNADEDYGRWVHVHGRPIRNDADEIVRVAGFCRDITAEKQREIELERQNDRLESFASVVSHDLRNPLNVASGHLELARDEFDSYHLDAIARAHDRMEELIEHLLELARAGERADTSAVDLEATARECWGDVATENASLVVDTDLVVEADAELLKQVFENLYRNAIQHGGPDVTVTVDDLDSAAGFYVEDDGPGIPPDTRERVFESGYTTSDTGTGLGLSIVGNIVDGHDWSIGVAKSEAGGARFEITDVDVVE